MIASFNSVSGSERPEPSRITGFSIFRTGPWLGAANSCGYDPSATDPFPAWITLKTPSRHSTRYKIRQELETELGDVRVGRLLLKSLGFEPSFRYQKFRTVLEPHKPSGKKLTVTLDETPIGNFLEIEGSARNILALSAKLGYKPTDFIQDSYWQLFQKRRSKSSGTSMIFRKRG